MERDGLGVNRHNESQCSSQYEDRSPAESHLKYPDREMAAQSKNKRPSYIGRMGSRQRQGTSMSPQSSRSYLNSGSPKMDDKKLQKEDNNSTDRKSSRYNYIRWNCVVLISCEEGQGYLIQGYPLL